MPSRTWDTMNDLEMTTAKIVSAREIIDAAVDAIQHHQNDKAETLMTAVYEFLEYYLNEFDEKFKLAWQETVVKQKKEEEDAWDAVNKVKKWLLPVDNLGECYFVSFPDDLLEAANLTEGDQVEWVDQGDGSYLLKKVNV